MAIEVDPKKDHRNMWLDICKPSFVGCCSHKREQGSAANENREHQTLSDFVGGETDGRCRFRLCPGPIRGCNSGPG